MTGWWIDGRRKQPVWSRDWTFLLMKNLAIFALILFFPVAALAQGTRVDVSAQYSNGDVVTTIQYAPATICTATATGIPCSPTTTIYSDIGLTTPIRQPGFTADSEGNIGFYVPAGIPIKWTINPNPLSPTGAGPFTLPPGGGTAAAATNGIQFVDSENSAGRAGSDIGAWINSAYTNCPSVGCRIVVTGGGSFTTPVVFSTSGKRAFVECIHDGITLTYTGSGTAFTWNNGNLQTANGMKGCTISGAGSSGATALSLGGSTGDAAFTFQDSQITSFSNAVVYGNNSWQTTFDHFVLLNDTVSINIPSTVSNSGENLDFTNGSISNTTTWVPNNVLINSAIADVKFTNMSFDDVQVVQTAGNVHYESPHFENPALVFTTPFVSQSGGVSSFDNLNIFNDISGSLSPTDFVDLSAGAATQISGLNMNSAGSIAYGIRLTGVASLLESGTINTGGTYTLSSIGVSSGNSSWYGLSPSYHVMRADNNFQFQNTGADNSHGVQISRSDLTREFDWVQGTSSATICGGYGLIQFSYDGAAFRNYTCSGFDGNYRILAPPVSSGLTATLSGTGACGAIGSQTGGQWAGSATCSNATAASTLTISPGTIAPHGWVCTVQDETTRTNLFQQTAHNGTSCTLTATSVTQNDVFVFEAVGF